MEAQTTHLGYLVTVNIPFLSPNPALWFQAPSPPTLLRFTKPGR